MKKILLYAIAGAISASGACFADTAGIEAACKQSDKLLWDARNGKCIPRNPCANEKYEQYCNRVFKDYESPAASGFYINLINIYAKTYGLQCEAESQRSKFIGHDYVVCQGTDVMVFEFKDIQDFNIFNRGNIENDYLEALCVATNGQMKDGICITTPVSTCTLVSNSITTVVVEPVSDINGCEIKISDEYKKAQEAAQKMADYNSKF